MAFCVTQFLILKADEDPPLDTFVPRLFFATGVPTRRPIGATAGIGLRGDLILRSKVNLKPGRHIGYVFITRH